MADLPTPPSPGAAGRAIKGKFTGRSPLFYAAFVGGVGILAWQIRKRESSAILAPDAGAVSPLDPPSPVGVGSFQGYDSADAMPSAGYVPGSQLQGTDVLNFVLDWQAQRQDYLLAGAQYQATNIPEPVAVPGQTQTGGGLPNQGIPNTAPPGHTQTHEGCPAAFPRWDGKGKRGRHHCYRIQHRHQCVSHRDRQFSDHVYQDGHTVKDHTGSKGGKC